MLPHTCHLVKIVIEKPYVKMHTEYLGKFVISTIQISRNLLRIYYQLSKATLVLEDLLADHSRPSMLQAIRNLKGDMINLLCGLRVYMDSRQILIPSRHQELLLSSTLPVTSNLAARYARNYSVVRKLDRFLLGAHAYISLLAGN